MRYLLPLLLLACGGGNGDPKVDSPDTDSGTTGETTDTDTGYGSTTTDLTQVGWLDGSLCYARNVFEVNCVTGCHSAVVAEGGLDLQTDVYGATVGKLSSIQGVQLVVPGQPENSLLYRKMTGDLQATEGGVMPPAGVLPDFLIEPVRVWIEQGAPNDCDLDFVEETTTDYTEAAPYHPDGWTAAGQHGLAANLQTDGDCRLCHGADLTGGVSGYSCDTCHAATWRTDCTFCHGGTLDATGAPPEDIDNVAVASLISFPGHTAHVDGDDHLAYGCEQCHDKPTDVLTYGHVFGDITPGYGEMDYTRGLAPISTYQAGTCSNNYCHGDGYNTLGTATTTDGPKACYSCHPDVTQGNWGGMSGEHELHLDDGILCSECHGGVVDGGQNVIIPSLHVNGTPDVQLNGMTYVGGTCGGNCHGHNHNNDDW